MTNEPVTIVEAPLSLDERRDLARHEGTIQRGQQTFIEVGLALADVNNRRLYREQHDSFEAYLQEHFPEISRRRAYQLIDGAETAQQLADVYHGTQMPPITSERQVRPLAGLEPDQKREVFKQAVEAAGGKAPTATQVEQAARAVKPPASGGSASEGTPAVAAPPLTLTPLDAETTPVGAATVITSAPATSALPPMLQINAPAPSALPPPLFAPAPTPMANPAPDEEFRALERRMAEQGYTLAWKGAEQHFALGRGTPSSETWDHESSFHAADWAGCRRRCEHLLTLTPPVPPAGPPARPFAVDEEDDGWAAVEDEAGPSIMVRKHRLDSLVANAIAHTADALRLIALGEAHAVDTELMLDLARALGVQNEQQRGTLRTILRIVADEADELARRSAPPPAPGTGVEPGSEDRSPLAALERQIAAAEGNQLAGPNSRRATADELQRALDALAETLDDNAYEKLAHRIGQFRGGDDASIAERGGV